MPSNSVRSFLATAKDKWKELCGGSLVAVGIAVAASMGFNVPASIAGLLAFTLAVIWACWLAFKDQHTKVLALEERLRPRITISCDRSVEGCVVPNHMGVWYRARLDSTGPSVADLEASILRVLEDGHQVDFFGEYLVASMCMNEKMEQKPIIREGRPEYINIAFGANDSSKPTLLSLKHYPGSAGERVYLKPGCRYQMDVVLNCDNTHPTLYFTVNLKLKSNIDVEEFTMI